MIVYEIAEDGRILYMDADPDHSRVAQRLRSANRTEPSNGHGGGFKNFRPLKLVGAAHQPNGAYIGGHIVPWPRSRIFTIFRSSNIAATPRTPTETALTRCSNTMVRRLAISNMCAPPCPAAM